MPDERLAFLEREPRRNEFASNAFSDGIVGMWWGVLGSSGVAVVLVGILGSLELVRHGTVTLSTVVGWVIVSVFGILFAAVGVGTICGFVAAAVAHYAVGALARGLAGAIGAMLFVVLAVAVVFEGDLSVVLLDGAGKLFLVTVVLAAGAGVMAGVNVGREVGS